ncbi:hypothetical protein ACFOZY_00175 [Chungangia koreensis]|uniref:DUF1616 domain-containing protein n=1 Tax=Chungangia koreensis TaxID=752657 RepID=A0ABV8X152_9LACT
MLIRKLVSSIVACILVMLISFLIEPSGFVIMIGMYLFPILLLYGLPSSIISDYVTKKLKGIVRGGVALVIHLLLAAVFVLILFIFGEAWVPVKVFLLFSVASSFLFWSIDKFLKSTIVKQIRLKIDDLKIY